VHSAKSPSTIEHLKAKRIHLEVCPSSNVQTRVCSAYHDHPADRLLRAGVSLGINTDARTITNVTLNKEYVRLREQFGWSQAQFRDCNQAALDGAFVDEPVKKRLISRLLAG
jgi:adenosine deaminase